MRAGMMTGAILRRPAMVVAAVALMLLMAGGLSGCGALDVSDPTAVEERELQDAAGAQLLRGAALKALSNIASDAAYKSGLLADEFLSDPPSWAAPGTWADELLDRRESVQYEELGADGGYTGWQELRRAATVAIPKLRAYAPAGAAGAQVGEMYALRAFAALRLAEDFCPGFPLHAIVDLQPVFGPPLSTEEAFARALADFDSAASAAVDSARVLHLVRVGQARALLGLGRLAEAASAVTDVPTAYVYQAEYGAPSPGNRLSFASWDVERSVADQEGGTGLAFVTAEDPRVLVTPRDTAADGVTPLYAPAKYPTPETPLVLASGIEARLIAAEAALAADEPSWLSILNTLRAEAISPALDPLADPGTAAARLDLLFRERAFWLFATGHRLADLRRLVQVYNRPANSVFPSGAYRLGGVYGTATSLPFPAARETPANPAITGCTSR